MAVCAVNCGIISDVVENGAYALLRNSILQSGKSPAYADCIEKVLKWQNPSKDFKANIFEPDRLLQHLKSELDTADFVCENRIVLAVGAIVLIVLLLLCICRACCS